MSVRLAVTVIALALGAALATASLVTGIATVARAAETPIPSVTTGDSVPYGSADADVAKLAVFGYVQQEFFISGTTAGKPYTTRILVRRPADPSQFSGIVVAESIRSTGSRSMWGIRTYLMRNGHAYVELGSNRLGIHNLVKPSNPTRYAALNVPDPGGLFFGHVHEIIAQGGMLLKSDPPDGPFAGFRVRRVILAGCSEQGLIIRLYMRDSHGLYRMAGGHPVFDGYFPACVADWPTSLSGLVVENFTPSPIDVPVINLATQQEPESWPDSGRLYRRPDSDEPDDRFCLYEVAGMPHGVTRRRTPGATTCDGQRTSRFPSEHVTNNALDKLIRWVDQGIVPPRADRLATAGPAGPIEVDENGNAVGGVRTTCLDVPIAAYRTCMLSGYEVPFSPQRLAERYQSSGDYVNQVNRRLDELIREGWYLEEDAQEIRTEAAQIALDWGRDGAF